MSSVFTRCLSGSVAEVLASIAIAVRPAMAEQVNMINALESLQAARA
jgi:hypothetical protein